MSNLDSDEDRATLAALRSGCHAPSYDSRPMPALAPEQRLYYGDNLEVLRREISDESVDLVYLDPPFNSSRDYSAVFGGRRPKVSRQEAKAFGDVWQWDAVAATSFAEFVARGGRAASTLQALRTVVGENDLLAYLSMMAPRLTELRRVMKPTASLFLHCDPTASHYLKLLLDGVLGPDNFRNEVIWRYRRWPTRSRQFQKMHDVLLFYSRSGCERRPFHTLYGYEELARSTLKTFGTSRQRADFSSGHRKPGKLADPSAGPPLSDVWEVSIIAPIGKERLGYPTQKPEALLERVLLSSTLPGDVVLDPFCGSGTTLAVAERLGRRSVGIDSTALAIGCAKRRLSRLVEHDIGAMGEPRSIAEAKTLARRSPCEYVWWVLGLLGAEPESGQIPTHDSVEGRRAWGAVEWLVSVRAEEAVAADLRGLAAAVSRREASGGLLVSLDAGRASGRALPGAAPLEHLTVDQLLRGERPHWSRRGARFLQPCAAGGSRGR